MNLNIKSRIAIFVSMVILLVKSDINFCTKMKTIKKEEFL